MIHRVQAQDRLQKEFLLPVMAIRSELLLCGKSSDTRIQGSATSFV